MLHLTICPWFRKKIAFIVIALLGISQSVLAAPYSISSPLGWQPPAPLITCDEDPHVFVPCETPTATPVSVLGTTTLPNPATGHYLEGTANDLMAAFSRRPLDHFIIPEGGLYLDQNDYGLHLGVDYANPDDYLNGRSTQVYPIGPGYVTARSDCWRCFVDGDEAGRVTTRASAYNFGFGGFILVETAVSPYVSLYVMYAHLSRDWVSLGDFVTPDRPIGLVGSTGFSQEFHLHLEVRYGPPARFWNADFTQNTTLDRWQATLYADPALLVFPQNHPAMVTKLVEWIALQPRAQELP